MITDLSSGYYHTSDITGPLHGKEIATDTGRYKIKTAIDQDKTGTLYKGQNCKTLQAATIKTIDISSSDKETLEESRESLFHLADAVRLLAHPNIVTVYGRGEENNLPFIAMEYFKGETLGHYSEKENLLPVRHVLNIIARVSDALDYAQKNGVVHQDLNPDSIIWDKETDVVKLTYFGKAQPPSYMSPEQISGKTVDGRTDIFSLGIILFGMLTGEKPFKGEDITSLLLKIAKGKHISPKAINPEIPKVVEKIIDKALEKNLIKRYQRAGNMAIHLKKVIVMLDEIQARYGSN